MDLSSNNYLEASTMFSSHHGGAILESKNGFCKNTSTKNPFLDSISDPLCKLNLKETSEFVQSFPVSNNTTQSRGLFDISAQRGTENGTKRNVEAPPTPGRPIFSFTNGRKNFPSKWDDAEKWLNSCNSSPNNNHHGNLLKSLEPSRMFTKQCSGYKPHLGEVFAEKSEEKVLKSDFNSARAINGVSLSASPEVLLKDKYPNEEKPIQEGLLFGNSIKEYSDNATIEMVKHRDIGTEMTPLGSSTTSRCHTPFASISPARHNTPANRSGPLAPTSFDSSNSIDMTQLQECHLAKLNLGGQFDLVAPTWSSREEEEDDVSKSLRHFEMNSECRKSVSESTCAWEEEEKTKRCLRYQREEAKIQAWVNLQSAKAEAESRKLEVKIQKMRSNLEEKLMKRMADVHRKAEEWRASAQFQHSEQIRKVAQQAQKVTNRNKSRCSGYNSCGCFPCNKHHT
ncbi:hypothetical protein BUALT_Bualt07G0170200 [Buddleja alternifolia]|uniref:Remorin C-terminal domain-containing protein n=1 Tax=Buddleja alternifolia TaxID=168488 RepID=A0AAV6XM10_9LAMI|nr:hypothetical protein BUALT_Bualt07G0170200 [Buddleja alternifolia]